ncbi:endo-1,4-beta-xylanase [Cellvibrio sp.]
MNINRCSLLAVLLALTACGGGSGSGSKSSSSSVVSSMLSSSAASLSSAVSSVSSSTDMSSISSSAITSSISSASSSSTPVVIELAENGGFEDSEAGSTAPANWSLANNEGTAVIQVISAANQPSNVHSGNRALEVAINTIGANPWSIETTHTGLNNGGIPVVGGSIYAYKAWVKGPAGAQANFTVGTPAPAYAERARSNVTLSGEWQEVSIEVTTSTDDTLLRLPVHFSLAANVGATIYVDDFSFTKVESITYEYSPVTVESLRSLSPGNMPIGVAVAAGNSAISPLTNIPRQTVVTQHFNQLTAENIMKPSFLQPTQGQFSFGDADALIDFAEANGLKVHGHTLLWHNQIPNWMQNFSGTKDQWLDVLRTHVSTVASHFAARQSVVSWDVVNEAFEDAGGRYRGSAANTGSSVWYTNIGPEFIEEAFKAAHAAAPNADLYYNDFSTEWNRPKLDAVVAMVEDFQARNIPIDGVGFQMHVWGNANVATIREHLKLVADIRPAIKVKITELDVRLNYVDPPLSANAYTPARADQHKALIKGIVEAYLEVVPAEQRGGITVWGVADVDSWINSLYGRPDWSLFFFNDMSPKPALQGFADALSGN